MYAIKTYSFKEVQSLVKTEALQQQLTRFAFLNLFLVAAVGVVLRSFPFISSFPLDYKNLLHGHSHFAFGGWVMPILLALVMKNFPELTERIGYHHWRNVAMLMLASAYGMLIAFPLQGYQAVSIFFSTLSLVSAFYWAVVSWNAMREVEMKTSDKFLKWGFIYFAISAIGPFATGPIMVMDLGKNLYFDAIYFFLHFQYNGFFSFVVLALLYKMMEKKGVINGSRTFVLFNASCIPTYVLSALWHQPSVVFNIVGGIAALLQITGLFYLLKDIRKVRWDRNWTNYLVKLSVVAFILKLFLQVVSALPFFALMAYSYRNFVIAYLHLVLLGFITLFAFAKVFESTAKNKSLFGSLSIFIVSFIATEFLLVCSAVMQLSGLTSSFIPQLLLLFSCFLMLSILSLVIQVKGTKDISVSVLRSYPSGVRKQSA